MRCGVVIFPGSNCDHDVYHVLKHVLDRDTVFLWHGAADLRGSHLVILPGGFSYGDYLRPGAMAAFSPIMAEVKRHAEAGGLVLGICNGFQILLEAGLLPGALRQNQGLRFECRDVHLRLERNDLPFLTGYEAGQVLSMPIAHAGGSYVDTEEALDKLEAAGQVVFRYVSPEGDLDPDSPEHNPNGSARGIAGITNAEGNVLGMMPHPERSAEEILGSTDGLPIFAAAARLAAEEVMR